MSRNGPFANSELESFTLPDGRALAFARWGDPAGAPVLYFHGGGESRLDRPHDLSALEGVHLVTVDRPGHGRSDFQPGRTLLDWPPDVTCLADRLGWDRFAVYGVSGGGPYVAVTAWALPDRITRAAIVSSALQRTEGPGVSFDQFGSAVAAAWPNVVQALESGPERGLDAWMSVVGGVDDCDRLVLSRPEVFAVGAEAIIEGARQGVAGIAYDLALVFTKPWGFDPAEIRVGVDVWHGSLDRIVPVGEAERTAATIPRAELHVIHDAGHMLAVDALPQILGRLLRSP
jgi:pimeloyl-ACP methyl ester carboxylesterase